MALGLMRAEDWERHAKKQEERDEEVAEWTEQAEKKKKKKKKKKQKKDKVTWEDLDQEPSKKLQGKVGGPFVRLRTKSRDFYNADTEEHVVTPNQATKKTKLHSAETLLKTKLPSAETLLNCNYFVYIPFVPCQRMITCWTSHSTILFMQAATILFANERHLD